MKYSRVTNVLFLIGILGLGLGGFQVLSIPSQRQETAESRSQLLVLQQKNEKLSGVLSEAQALEDNLEMVRQALPTTDDVPALLMQLEEIAKQSGVAVQHLGFGEGAKPSSEAEEAESRGAVKSVSLTAVVAGSYDALRTFFNNLEETLRIVNVTNFRFSPAQQKEAESALSITLGIKAFYLDEVTEISTEEPLTLDTGSKEYVDLIKRVKQLR